MENFGTKVQWSTDEEFEYILPDNKPLTVSWNMYGDEIGITTVEWGKDNHYTGDELWEMDIDLAEDIVSYIENEFIHDEDFWMTKMGYDF
jgi:hypothetical protein